MVIPGFDEGSSVHQHGVMMVGEHGDDPEGKEGTRVSGGSSVKSSDESG